MEAGIPGGGNGAQGNVVVGAENGGGRIGQRQQRLEPLIARGHVHFAGADQRFVVGDFVVGQGPEIAHQPLPGRKDGVGAGNQRNAPVALPDQMAYGLMDGPGVVGEDSVGFDAGDDPVHLDHRNGPGPGELLKLLPGEILREIDQPVHAGINQKTQIVPLQPVERAIAGDDHVIAVGPQRPVQGPEDRAEEGRRKGGQQDAHRAAALGLEPAGVGIGPVVQRRNGPADGLLVFGADVAAVEIF